MAFGFRTGLRVCSRGWDRFWGRAGVGFGATELPGTITVAQPSHVHANWVFGKTGVYTMTVQATAHRSGKK
ncbi:TIGR03769 domain-containing protein, partial [Cutibacterium acnes]|nr:TIGR03769 domain-containing protein [Cutibacterium acnes]